MQTLGDGVRELLRVVGGEVEIPGRTLGGTDTHPDHVGAGLDSVPRLLGDAVGHGSRGALHAILVEGVGGEVNVIDIGTVRQTDRKRLRGLAPPVQVDSRRCFATSDEILWMLVISGDPSRRAPLPVRAIVRPTLSVAKQP